MLGDIDRAEDALQDASEKLIRTFAAGPLPSNLNAWLLRTARNCAIDRVRREKRGLEKLALLENLERAVQQAGEHDTGGQAFPDDRLELIFTCCHPALNREARVALTLRTLCGLSTAEIASAFFVPEATMAKRVSRAKNKIREALVPFIVPDALRLRDRLLGVFAVIYLIFNEGYKATSGRALLRVELCEEAIRLARVLCELLPAEPDASGLLALMLTHHSRHRARVNERGDLVLLGEQDRSLWQTELIVEARALVDQVSSDARTPYLVEAEIALEHAEAPSEERTNWRRIAALFEVLHLQVGSPIVALNRAVAIGMAFGFERGLAALDSLGDVAPLRDYYLLHAARADFLRRLDRIFEAEAAYRRALQAAPTETETAFLRRRLDEVRRAVREL